MAPAEASGGSGFRLTAPAKLNLYLHVTGRRADGYHRLDSLIVFAALGDVVEVTPAGDLSLAITGRFAAGLGDAADNLVMRAARLLSLEAGLPAHRGAAIRLEKNLPVAAGLGGGSADAAAALHGLCALWNVSPGADDLARMAISLGADVPVCLSPRPAFVGGIGESIESAPALPALHVALINPGEALSTASVFANLEIKPSERQGRFAEAPRDTAALVGLLASRANDLDPPARRLCPAVVDVLSALGRQADCLLARMSGSGATCFGLFDSAAAAAAAARHIAERQPAWWAVSSPLIGDSDKVEILPIPAYM